MDKNSYLGPENNKDAPADFKLLHSSLKLTQTNRTSNKLPTCPTNNLYALWLGWVHINRILKRVPALPETDFYALLRRWTHTNESPKQIKTLHKAILVLVVCFGERKQTGSQNKSKPFPKRTSRFYCSGECKHTESQNKSRHFLKLISACFRSCERRQVGSRDKSKHLLQTYVYTFDI